MRLQAESQDSSDYDDDDKRKVDRSRNKVSTKEIFKKRMLL